MKNKRLHSLQLVGIFCLTLLFTTDAFALTLQDAKTQGLVGERPSGYIGLVVATASADAQALVKDINGKRRAHYNTIAQRNKTKVSIVETLAGKKAIEKTAPGQYFQLLNGTWNKK